MADEPDIDDPSYFAETPMDDDDVDHDAMDTDFGLNIDVDTGMHLPLLDTSKMGTHLFMLSLHQ